MVDGADHRPYYSVTPPTAEDRPEAQAEARHRAGLRHLRARRLGRWEWVVDGQALVPPCGDLAHRRTVTMRRVILVTGPPCAGKTSYVRQHAGPDDTVLDQDVIGARAMTAALRRLPSHGTTWVIRCAPGPSARAELVRSIGATDHVHLAPSRDELIARAKHRPNRRQAIAAVGKWIAAELADAPSTVRSTATRSRSDGQVRAYRKGRPYRRAKATLQGNTQTCWLCGHAGAYELDHEPALTLLLDMGLDPNDAQYHRAAHGSSCPCPTCGQRCNQAKGAGAGRVRMSCEW